MASNAVDIFHHIHGYVTTRALITACNLKIFDLLKSGPQSVQELCVTINTDHYATQQLLNALVAMGYIAKKEHKSASRRDKSEVRFHINETSEKYLTSASPHSMIPVVELTERTMFPLARNLSHAVREGRPQMERAFGNDSSKMFLPDLLASNPDEWQYFMMAMHAYRKNFHCDAATQLFDLSSYRCACDLGGGTGVVSFALSDAYPAMKIIVYDLPIVIDIAQQFLHQRSPYFKSNVSFQAGDPLQNNLPKADLFVLSGSIHIWPEDQLSIVLAKIYEALSSDGALLILEPVLGDNSERGDSNLEMFSLVVLMAFGSRQPLADGIPRSPSTTPIW
ncbi:probable bifunctional dTTP/UTP pyrophosphatase/methyltransferase protein [Ptychodera flava]|uniref:probable bifunctional dTTP/UTP pyrophosphatase/methyltransferase protein n=1 Tax=Ptychodera flava TaxID=63121 RepID=UPI00396A58E3